MASWVSGNFQQSVSTTVARRALSLFAGEYFVAETDLRRLSESSRRAAVFILAQLNRALHSGLVELSAQSINQFQFHPHRRRLGRALSLDYNFQGLQFLPLLRQYQHNVRGGARTQRRQH